MPNIYLRMPTSRCQFFRHRDPNKPLAKNEPVVFSSFAQESFIIRNSLSNAQSIEQILNDRCYSHQQWRNMLHGRSPLGGKPIVKRDPKEYLTFNEVQMLVGKKDYTKAANVDYLCIQLPTEIEVIDTVRDVTPTWNLDRDGVRQLSTFLNNDFKRTVMNWALATFDFCTCKGQVVCRAQSAMLERFLMRYEIEPTQAEKDSLRRIIERWMKTEHQYFSAYSCMEMRYLDEREARHLIRGVKWL